mgnify:CR=1 FL=1
MRIPPEPAYRPMAPGALLPSDKGIAGVAPFEMPGAIVIGIDSA